MSQRCIYYNWMPQIRWRIDRVNISCTDSRLPRQSTCPLCNPYMTLLQHYLSSLYHRVCTWKHQLRHIDRVDTLDIRCSLSILSICLWDKSNSFEPFLLVEIYLLDTLGIVHDQELGRRNLTYNLYNTGP